MKQVLLACVSLAACCTPMMAQVNAENVVGRYAGDLYVALGEEIYTDDARMYASVLVNKSNKEAEVDFSLPNFAFAGMSLGDIFLPNIPLNYTNNTYSFGANPNVRFNFLNGEIVADASLDDKRSYIKGDSIVAYIPVKWIQSESMSMPIYVLFKGKLQSPFTLENGNFNTEDLWTRSKPWDSKNGYFDWSALEDNDEYWESSKWEIDDYITPSPWCISHVIGINGIGATCVGAHVQTNEDEDNPDYAVKLINTPNPFMSTQIVPGYMTLGTSWATANAMNLDETADGGAFGGIAFKGKPDAIKFSYTRSFGKDNTEESYNASALNDKEPATVVAYLWKGEYKQEKVPGNTEFGTTTTATMYGRDRNILGLSTTTGGATTHSDDAACIAQVVKNISGETKEMTEMTIALDYGKYAGTDIQPDSLNIVFSASDYFGKRSKVGAGNTLTIDNVELVYYHALKDVTYDGKPVTFSADNVATLSDISYEPNKLAFTKVGEGATISQSFDQATGLLTIQVASQNVKFDPTAVTTYTIQFSTIPSAVNSVVAGDNNKAERIYTIDGRRANTTTKGVNIVNGKKVVK